MVAKVWRRYLRGQQIPTVSPFFELVAKRD